MHIVVMDRLLYNDLLKWKENPRRKPLILKGARQVGKTWLLRHFGEHEYESVAYISCERHANLDEVFSDFSAERMIRALSALSQVDIKPGKTLVIIDEIQEYPRALTALKYFCEDAPDYHVAVAGSLLGVSMHQGISFPVGKVDFLTLHPLTFVEFVRAVGRPQAADAIERGDVGVLNSLTSFFEELLRQYYFVGGMPAVVRAFCEKAGPNEVRKIQRQILSDYRNDFSKHVPAPHLPKVNLVWNDIPRQLAKENKKFQYSGLKRGGRAAEFELAIQWLVDAGLVHRVHRVSRVEMPLKFYEEQSVFKLFMLDVGLLGAMMDAPAAQVLVGDNVFREYKGAFTEEYVLTQLRALGKEAWYYGPNDSKIELDFVVQTEKGVLPIEVKAEENVRSKSLRTFVAKHPELLGVRYSMKPFVRQEWMVNLPLWNIRGIDAL